MGTKSGEGQKVSEPVESPRNSRKAHPVATLRPGEAAGLSSSELEEEPRPFIPRTAGTLVFQRLEPQHLPVAWYWRIRGHRVFYRTAPRIPGRVLSHLGAEPVFVDPKWDQYLRIELVDSVFQHLFEGGAHLAWCRRFFGTADIDQAFRRLIVDELEDFFFTLEGILCAGLPAGGEIVLAGCSMLVAGFVDLVRNGRLPAGALEEIDEPHRQLMRRIQVGRPSRLVGLVRLFAEVAYACVFVLKRLCWATYPRRQFQVAIRTYLTDWGCSGTEPRKLREVDFVVDGVDLLREQTVFWLENNVYRDVEKLNRLTEQGYLCVYPSRLPFDPEFARHTALPALKAYLGYRFSAGLLIHFESQICLRFWRYYLLTAAFAEYFRPRYFLVYNDVSYLSTARNVVLRARGCASVFYAHSYNWTIETTGYYQRRPWVSFLNYDVLISWGHMQSDQYRNCGGRFARILMIGCLWSEHARLVKEDTKIRTYYAGWIERNSDKKLSDFRRIVGVFDTSISSMLLEDDMYAFLTGILKVAEEMPEVMFLYKPKNPFAECEPGESPPLIEIFGDRGRVFLEKIRSTSNFVVLPRRLETACVVGLSDLVISACYTSTAVEAIGSRTPAVYYDATDKFSYTFWNWIPGMVCRTPEELRERVQELVYKFGSEDYLAYLQKYCADLEAYFDGRAITRLRRYLMGEHHDV